MEGLEGRGLTTFRSRVRMRIFPQNWKFYGNLGTAHKYLKYFFIFRFLKRGEGLILQKIENLRKNLKKCEKGGGVSFLKIQKNWENPGERPFLDGNHCHKVGMTGLKVVVIITTRLFIFFISILNNHKIFS